MSSGAAIACALVSVLLLAAPAFCQSPATSGMEEFLAQESKMSQLTRAGYGLTKEQAAALEEALAKAPDNLDARAKLLGYYFARASQSLGTEARIQARRKHILWLVGNRPESALLRTSEATLTPRGNTLSDPEGYEQTKQAWLELSAKKDVSAAMLGNAGRFFYLPDKGRAVEMYAHACKLDPANPLWVMMQGSVMAFAVVGITDMNQNGFPGAADPAEAGSVFAKSARRELETTKDTALMMAAAAELSGRGVMAQAMAHAKSRAADAVDALTLAESLLKRAQDLDPGKSAASLALARIYELRGMSAASDAEKKALAQARYEQLVKGTAGLATDDPANAQQTLILARASMDAGDLDRAQTLANSLLAIEPKLGADPKLKWSVDGIHHHGHLILGRVALRRGDMDAAKANLLEAGRVGGGGTLSSFGPNMTLAKELLEKGEKEVVLQYLELCRKFWTFQQRMDPWIESIRKGEMPNFGANLTY